MLFWFCGSGTVDGDKKLTAACPCNPPCTYLLGRYMEVRTTFSHVQAGGVERAAQQLVAVKFGLGAWGAGALPARWAPAASLQQASGWVPATTVPRYYARKYFNTIRTHTLVLSGLCTVRNMEDQLFSLGCALPLRPKCTLPRQVDERQRARRWSVAQKAARTITARRPSEGVDPLAWRPDELQNGVHA